MSDLVKELLALADHTEFKLDPEQATEHWLATAEVVGALRKAADALSKLSEERDQATAEAAELRELLSELKATAQKDGHLSKFFVTKIVDITISQPGPGAALLKERDELKAKLAKIGDLRFLYDGAKLDIKRLAEQVEDLTKERNYWYSEALASGTNHSLLLAEYKAIKENLDRATQERDEAVALRVHYQAYAQALRDGEVQRITLAEDDKHDQ